MKLLLVCLLSMIGCAHGAVTLTLDSGGTVSFAFVDADYDINGVAQKTVASGSRLTIDKSGGAGYTFHARALTSTFSLTPDRVGDNYAKPCGGLGVKVSTSGTYVPLTTSDQLLASASANRTVYNIDYRLNSNLSLEVPGTYTLTVVFTVTQP